MRLKIAILSFEFPPDTAIGGIGTYTQQVSKALFQSGHHIEVFTSSPHRSTKNEEKDGLIIHRIQTSDRKAFRKLLLPVLLNRHQQVNFDIIESPEYEAEGLDVKTVLPFVPLVVKFHTPSFLIKEMNRSQKAFQFKYKIKRFFNLGQYQKQKDDELKLSKMADGLSSPSKSLAKIIADRWQIAESKINIIPNCYLPSPALLAIPSNTNTQCVSYIGRLEARKGVHLLAEIIPSVLKQFPETIFRFIGKSNMGPKGIGTMENYLKNKLKPWMQNLEFIEHVPLNEIPACLEKTDICIFPSLWENFPNVCLEAMAAARGIIASKNGGMAEMLEDINGGVLIDPLNVEQLKESITDLLQQPSRRIEMGERARKKINNYYAKQVPQMNVDFYKKIISSKSSNVKD